MLGFARRNLLIGEWTCESAEMLTSKMDRRRGARLDHHLMGTFIVYYLLGTLLAEALKGK